MIRWLNKKYRKNFNLNRKVQMSSKKGQVALVLILATAIALIFYAVVLNLGRVSQVKTSTQLAATTGASMLASSMTSIGQSIFMETMGGKVKICDKTGVFEALLTLLLIVIIIIIIIISCVYAGCAGLELIELIPYLVVAAVLSVANVALQAFVVQPGLTNAWSKIMAATLTPEDGFLETGIRSGFQTITTDLRQTPDLFDWDQDGEFGYTGNQPNDYISRPSLYYDMRMKGIVPRSNPLVSAFLDTLNDFIYEDPLGNGSTWALYDPIPEPAVNPSHICNDWALQPQNQPAGCNQCCVPATVIDPRDGVSLLPVRPSCCDHTDPAINCGTVTTCGVNSPYPNYQFQYAEFYEDDQNAFLSFRETLGRDDEHSRYFKDFNNPNSDPRFGPQQQTLEQLSNVGFYLKDATSYYTEDLFGAFSGSDYISQVFTYPSSPPPPGDIRRGVYPFFYKISDWGTELALTDPVSFQEHCYWVDDRDPTLGPICAGVALEQELTQSKINNFPIPHDVADPDPFLRPVYNTTFVVDGSNPPTAGPTDPPLHVDKVALPGNILAQGSECAQIAHTANTGFWKRGVDRHCTNGDFPTTEWPYNNNCPKHQAGSCTVPDGTGTGGTISVDCDCLTSSAGTNVFNEDIIDDLVYEIPLFLKWSTTVLSLTPQQQILSFRHWYSLALSWLEPGVGKIHEWQAKMDYVIAQLEGWRDTSFEGADCYEAWCVPPSGCAEVPPEEAATFDANGNGTPGDIEDVVACLNHNIEGHDFGLGTTKPLGTGEGNDWRFKECRDKCDLASCDFNQMPRSLTPTSDYDPNDSTNDDPSAGGSGINAGKLYFQDVLDPQCQPNVTDILTCLDTIPLGNIDTCTSSELTACRNMPQQQATASGSCHPYFTQDPSTFQSGPCGYDCELQYFTQNPATNFNELAHCYGNLQYFATDPATFDFLTLPECTDRTTWPTTANPWWNEMQQATFFLTTLGCSDDILMPNYCGDFDAITGCMDWYLDPAEPRCDNGACQLMPQFPTDPSFWYGANNLAIPIPPNGWAVQANDDLIRLAAASDDITSISCNFANGSDADYNAISNCYNNCSDANCKAMPQYRNNQQWAAGLNPWYDQAEAAKQWLLSQSPPRGLGDPDFNIIAACQAACTSCGWTADTLCDTTCRLMPMFDTTCAAPGSGVCTGGPPIPYFSENPSSAFAGNDCGSNVAECPNGWGPGCMWYDRIVGQLGSPAAGQPTTDDGAVAMANRSCDLRPSGSGTAPATIYNDRASTNNNGFLLNTEIASIDAANQVSKFKQRRDFLHNRMKELNNTTQVFTTARTELEQLITDAAPLFNEFNSRSNLSAGLPDSLIYAWQDDSPNITPVRNGYWHVIKVEGRLPLRCYDGCGVGAGPSPDWPSVKTKTSGFLNTTRCYELINRSGIIKFRATRWDEDREPNSVTFPNGTPLWSFHNPASSSGDEGLNLSAECGGSYYSFVPFLGSLIPSSITGQELDRQFGQAFMLNKRSDNPACWDRASNILGHGVDTEVCAEYYYHGGATSGFGFKFIPCPGGDGGF